jgi:hypothetical protein
VSIKAFIVKNLLRISPSTVAADSAGEMRVDSSDSNKLKFHDGSTEESVVLAPALATVSGDLATHEADVSTHGVTEVVGTSEAQALTNKTIDADSNTITNIEDADIKTGAAIARTKLASGTADHVLINDGFGASSSEAQLAIARGGTGQATANAAFNALVPDQTANSGKVLSTDGSNTSWATVSAGANTVLSNLATTEINQDLIHGTAGTNWTVRTANNGAGNSGNMIIRTGTATGTRGYIQAAADSIVLGDVGVVTVIPANGGAFGSTTAPWSVLNSGVIGIYAAGYSYEIYPSPVTIPTGVSVQGTIKTNTANGFAIYSVSQAGNTGALRTETGNSSSFASGDIENTTGTANTTSGDFKVTIGTAAGTQGNVKLLKSGVPSVVGQRWNATATDGAGYWSDPDGAKIFITGPQSGFGALAQVVFTSADEEFDTGTNIGTNELTVPVTGYYTVTASAYSPTNSATEFIILYYSVNNGGLNFISGISRGSADAYPSGAGATSVMHIYANQGDAGNISFSFLRH